MEAEAEGWGVLGGGGRRSGGDDSWRNGGRIGGRGGATWGCTGRGEPDTRQCRRRVLCCQPNGVSAVFPRVVINLPNYNRFPSPQEIPKNNPDHRGHSPHPYSLQKQPRHLQYENQTMILTLQPAVLALENRST